MSLDERVPDVFVSSRKYASNFHANPCTSSSDHTPGPTMVHSPLAGVQPKGRAGQEALHGKVLAERLSRIFNSKAAFFLNECSSTGGHHLLHSVQLNTPFCQGECKLSRRLKCAELDARLVTPTPVHIASTMCSHT